jgi:hypothetical protein
MRLGLGLEDLGEDDGRPRELSFGMRFGAGLELRRDDEDGRALEVADLARRGLLLGMGSVDLVVRLLRFPLHRVHRVGAGYRLLVSDSGYERKYRLKHLRLTKETNPRARAGAHGLG